MQANGTSPTAFLLELGLTSFAGRNFEAALHWLGSCKEILLEPANAQDIDNSKLGAVCGSQVMACELGCVVSLSAACPIHKCCYMVASTA